MPLDRRMLWLIVVVGAAACSDATAPDEPRVTVTVQQEVLPATLVNAGTVTWLQFAVPLVIHNTGRRSVSFEYCASSIEARVGGQWDAAWGPVCVASSTPTVAPGESREVSVSVTAAMSGPGGPDWRTGTLDGTYRFVAGLALEGSGGVIPTVASNSFTLRAGN